MKTIGHKDTEDVPAVGETGEDDEGGPGGRGRQLYLTQFCAQFIIYAYCGYWNLVLNSMMSSLSKIVYQGKANVVGVIR